MIDVSLRLDNQLCFALYSATHAITRLYRSELDKLGLTYPQYLVLVTLFERPTMTSGAVAKALRLDAGTLTPLFKRLANLGYISRMRRPDDDRVVEITLTEKGRQLYESLSRARAKIVHRTGLANGDLMSLRSKLTALTNTLSDGDRC